MSLCQAATLVAETLLPPAQVVKAGVAVHLRPQQRLGAGPSQDHVFVVRSGVVLLEAHPQREARQILDIYYRGDVIRSGGVPAIAGAGLVTATQAEVLRVPVSKLADVLNAEPESSRWLDCALARQYSRRLLHTAVIGSLAGEERVATLLVEFALRVGEPGYEGACTFELPLSRTEMADYLSLNADTLSRIMSRLRQANVIGTSGRGRAYTPSLAALCKLSPLAEAVTQLHRPAP